MTAKRIKVRCPVCGHALPQLRVPRRGTSYQRRECWCARWLYEVTPTGEIKVNEETGR